MCKLRKASSKYNRDKKEKDHQRWLNDCIVFRGLDNINEMLNYVL